MTPSSTVNSFETDASLYIEWLVTGVDPVSFARNTPQFFSKSAPSDVTNATESVSICSLENREPKYALRASVTSRIAGWDSVGGASEKMFGRKGRQAGLCEETDGVLQGLPGR